MSEIIPKVVGVKLSLSEIRNAAGIPYGWNFVGITGDLKIVQKEGALIVNFEESKPLPFLNKSSSFMQKLADENISKLVNEDPAKLLGYDKTNENRRNKLIDSLNSLNSLETLKQLNKPGDIQENLKQLNRTSNIQENLVTIKENIKNANQNFTGRNI